MVIICFLIISMNSDVQTYQKIEHIQSKEECYLMNNNFTEQMSYSKFACTPYNVYEENK